MSAETLIQSVETLGARYGLERSIKMLPGALDRERYLLSVGRASLGPDPVERLHVMLDRLEPPRQFSERWPAALDRADIVHLGYEAAGGRDVYKVYFEYADDVRRAMAERASASVLVHLAYKWCPSKPESNAVTRYSWLPCPDRAALEAKIRGLVPAAEAPVGQRCVLELLSRVTGSADPDELLLMEVEEPGNVRRSCDINVYDAGLRMHQIEDVLDDVVRGLSIPSVQAKQAFAGVRELALGHLSAGVARDGREFVTVYFGVEAR